MTDQIGNYAAAPAAEPNSLRPPNAPPRRGRGEAEEGFEQEPREVADDVHGHTVAGEVVRLRGALRQTAPSPARVIPPLEKNL
jgi:hypothetical protein